MSGPRLTKRAGLEPTLWIATALCVITLGLTYFEGGQEGICSNVTDFANEHQDAAGWRKEYSLWPPGRTCVALKADGSVLAQRTYPEPEDWLLALALFAAPIGLWAVWPRLRRQSSGAPPAP